LSKVLVWRDVIGERFSSETGNRCGE